MRGKDLIVGKNDQGFAECGLPLPIKLWAQLYHKDLALD